MQGSVVNRLLHLQQELWRSGVLSVFVIKSKKPLKREDKKVHSNHCVRVCGGVCGSSESPDSLRCIDSQLASFREWIPKIALLTSTTFWLNVHSAGVVLAVDEQQVRDELPIDYNLWHRANWSDLVGQNAGHYPKEPSQWKQSALEWVLVPEDGLNEQYPQPAVVAVVVVVVPVVELHLSAKLKQYRHLFCKCCNKRRLTPGSIPGKRLTSLTQSVKPDLNLLIILGSIACCMAACCRCSSCKCLTVFSNISAFSNFECRAGCNEINDADTHICYS
ncbi:hypothetical protein GQX74_012896 [Glossina fuscipes]|nr:hypothetical protein GQX74_012896 [Glossina fuscipes]